MLWIRTSRGDFLNLATASGVKVAAPDRVLVTTYGGHSITTDEFTGRDAELIIGVLNAAANDAARFRNVMSGE